MLYFYSNSFFIILFLLILFDSYKKLEGFSGWRVSYKWVIFPSYCRMQFHICPFLIGGDSLYFSNVTTRWDFWVNFQVVLEKMQDIFPTGHLLWNYGYLLANMSRQGFSMTHFKIPHTFMKSMNPEVLNNFVCFCERKKDKYISFKLLWSNNIQHLISL